MCVCGLLRRKTPVVLAQICSSSLPTRTRSPHRRGSMQHSGPLLDYTVVGWWAPGSAALILSASQLYLWNWFPPPQDYRSGFCRPSWRQIPRASSVHTCRQPRKWWSPWTKSPRLAKCVLSQTQFLAEVLGWSHSRLGSGCNARAPPPTPPCCYSWKDSTQPFPFSSPPFKPAFTDLAAWKRKQAQVILKKKRWYL